MITSLLGRLLVSLGYPSFPPPSQLLGEYRVGAVQLRIPGGTNCQILYPTNDDNDKDNQQPGKNSHPQQHFPYFRPQAVEGVANYSRQPKSLLQFLSIQSHPCLMNATPLPGPFPIVVFSHGLGGCMEMYTLVCQQIASCGYWVIALEHQDGSGAYAEEEVVLVPPDKETTTSTTRPIYYKRPDDTPYSRTKVVQFRKPFLEQRIQEITKVVEYTMDPKLSSSTSSMDPLLHAKVFQAADTKQGIHLLGHSFGGATMVQLSQDKTFTKQHEVKSLNVLDCWAFSLTEDSLQKGCFNSRGDITTKVDTIPPTLSILSEAWVRTNTETRQVQELMEHSSHVSSFFIRHCIHASFSDISCWLPHWIAKRLHMRGAHEASTHETIRTAAKACVQHIQRTPVTSDETKHSLLSKLDIDHMAQAPQET